MTIRFIRALGLIALISLIGFLFFEFVYLRIDAAKNQAKPYNWKELFSSSYAYVPVKIYSEFTIINSGQCKLFPQNYKMDAEQELDRAELATLSGLGARWASDENPLIRYEFMANYDPMTGRYDLVNCIPL